MDWLEKLAEDVLMHLRKNPLNLDTRSLCPLNVETGGLLLFTCYLNSCTHHMWKPRRKAYIHGTADKHLSFHVPGE